MGSGFLLANYPARPFLGVVMTKTKEKNKEKPKFSNGVEKVMSPKQLRARARRKAKKGKDITEELEHLYKPVEDWDIEELARGRPRAKDGTFSGRPPTWITRAVYEQAMERFTSVVREGVHSNAVTALTVIEKLLECDELDDKGKPLVPAGVKLQAAQWLIEHTIGKPTQRVEQNISVKLQAVLAQSVFTSPHEAAMQGPVTPVIEAAPTEDIWDVDAEDDDE